MSWLLANWFELTASLVTAVSIWLATKEKIWYYPTGIVSVLMYAWFFFSNKLYAESVLQLIWLALMLYGWYEWLHGGTDRTELPVTRTPRWAWLSGVVTGVVGSAVVIAVQLRFTDNPQPYIDSSLMVWSLVAQWMTARKWIENWLLWIVINTIATPFYWTRGYALTAVLYAALWALAIVGYRQWRRTLESASA